MIDTDPPATGCSVSAIILQGIACRTKADTPQSGIIDIEDGVIDDHHRMLRVLYEEEACYVCCSSKNVADVVESTAALPACRAKGVATKTSFFSGIASSFIRRRHR